MSGLLFNAVVAALVLTCTSAFRVKKVEQKQCKDLCDNSKAEARVKLDFSIIDGPVIFKTEDVRVAWANGTKTYLGNIMTLDEEDGTKSSDKTRASKGAKKRKSASKPIWSYIQTSDALTIPDTFLERLFKNEIQIEKETYEFGAQRGSAKLLCNADFKMEFKIGGKWMSISSKTLIVSGQNNEDADGEETQIKSRKKKPSPGKKAKKPAPEKKAKKLPGQSAETASNSDGKWCDARFEVAGSYSITIWYGNVFWHHVCLSCVQEGVLTYSNKVMSGTEKVTEIGLSQKTVTEPFKMQRKW